MLDCCGFECGSDHCRRGRVAIGVGESSSCRRRKDALVRRLERPAYGHAHADRKQDKQEHEGNGEPAKGLDGGRASGSLRRSHGLGLRRLQTCRRLLVLLCRLHLRQQGSGIRREQCGQDHRTCDPIPTDAIPIASNTGRCTERSWPCLRVDCRSSMCGIRATRLLRLRLLVMRLLLLLLLVLCRRLLRKQGRRGGCWHWQPFAAPDDRTLVCHSLFQSRQADMMGRI